MNTVFFQKTNKIQAPTTEMERLIRQYKVTQRNEDLPSDLDEDLCYKEFYKEAERVLRSQGVLAVFGYYPTEPSPKAMLTDHQIKALNDLRNHLYEDVVGKYWAPEIRLSYDFGYKTIIPLPFPNVERFDEFYIETEGTIEDFAGYIQTWSAFQTFQTAEGVEKAKEVIENFIKSAKQTCPGVEKLLLRTRFFMLLGVKP